MHRHQHSGGVKDDTMYPAVLQAAVWDRKLCIFHRPTLYLERDPRDV